ncbi:MAG: hypothetical protein IT365_21675 [Candidatus Hydrogenedentes bacterium]|nr:hypothetical protein [Candidatus Hydrogenedentota bacterium]
MMFQGWPGFPGLYRSFWDQFTFGDGDPSRTQRFLDYGFFPWWHELESCTQPWRVFSTFTHWLDFRLWPASPFLMHVHSLLWFGAMVGAGTVLYRRIHGATWVAGLAALIFAVDDAHGWAVGWLANRNALTSALFGILTLIAHDRWRKDRSAWGALLAPVWFVLALLSAEAALAVAAYLLAYAVFIEKSESTGTHGTVIVQRVRALATLIPYAVVAVVWQFFYKLLGFGAWGLALYVDPGREPLRFLEAIIDRAPYLLLGQWAFPPSDIYVWLSLDSGRWMWVAAVLALGLLTLFIAPRLRRDRVSGFWCFGMLASVIPICSTLPQDRLLFFVGLGASPLIARYVQRVLEGTREAPAWRRLSIATVALLLVIHVPMAAISLPIRAYSPTIMQQVTDCIETASLGPEVREQTVVLVNAPSHFYAMYLPVLRTLSGEPCPKRVRSLGPNPESFAFESVPMRIRRTDAHTLVIRPEGGYEARPVLRDAAKPMRLGDAIRVEGMTATITDMTVRGNPAAVAFTFDVPLDDPSLCWLQWKDNTLIPFSPPAVGSEATL